MNFPSLFFDCTLWYCLHLSSLQTIRLGIKTVGLYTYGRYGQTNFQALNLIHYEPICAAQCVCGWGYPDPVPPLPKQCFMSQPLPISDAKVDPEFRVQHLPSMNAQLAENRERRGILKCRPCLDTASCAAASKSKCLQFFDIFTIFTITRPL